MTDDYLRKRHRTELRIPHVRTTLRNPYLYLDKFSRKPPKTPYN